MASRLGRVPHIGEVADELGVSRDELHRLRDRLFRSVILAFDHLVTDSPDEELTLVDVIEDVHSVEPCHELEKRELHAYLRDAIALLPERQRLVIVGYFLQDRTSQDLARFLGVTESRISQLRSEALEMLRDGITAQYEQDQVDEAPQGRVARRKAAYAGAARRRSPAAGPGSLPDESDHLRDQQHDSRGDDSVDKVHVDALRGKQAVRILGAAFCDAMSG